MCLAPPSIIVLVDGVRKKAEAQDQDQRYLKPYEEDVVVKFLVQMSNLGQPIWMKFIPSIAFSAARQQLRQKDR